LAIANLTSNPAPLPRDLIGDRQPLLSTAEQRFGGPRKDCSAIDRLSSHELILWGDASWK
jgi:hypothetical protein